ncbi:hypothetical protein ACMXYX_17770 (plasmid) [Neptuniibacter sp. QD72_48]|uniref:hypothetical protein n=1 Tax=Neptuniibacter sp. QD72_48 TaxID=3398214 RepID=UPI0039F59A41
MAKHSLKGCEITDYDRAVADRIIARRYAGEVPKGKTSAELRAYFNNKYLKGRTVEEAQDDWERERGLIDD